MIALLAPLWAKFGGYLLTAGATLAAIFGVWRSGRRSGAQAAVADAAKQEQEATHAGNQAAADAGRDGAAKRLRDGGF